MSRPSGLSAGHALIGSLDDDGAFFLPLRCLDDGCLRKRANHIDVNGPHLGAAVLPEIVTGFLNILRRTS